jgi:predicted metal-dependent HD superfamily phosphohydrolase/phosphopantetheine adenylyltransferase
MRPDRWLALANRLGVAEAVADRWWRELHARYTEPGRYYHTLDHLRELLALSDTHARVIEERDAVELAIWFHDLVYDARGGGGGKNERESAEAFRRFAAEAGCLEPALVARVCEWIEATATHRAHARTHGDGKLFLDFDMAVLAKDAAGYDAYAAQIRAEYRHVWAPLYWAARARFLEAQATGAGRPVFQSDQLAHLEPLARSNAAREARALRSRLTTALSLGAAAVACGPLAWSCGASGSGWRACAKGACALLASSGALHWLFARRGFFAFPYAGMPSGRVAVLAASFNPPHAGHVELLRALASRYAVVYAVVGANASKRYDVTPEERRALLAVMVQSAGLSNVRVATHVGYVWRFAHAVGADCLYRGIRSWRADGASERMLELLNALGPLLLAPLGRPLRTYFLGADPRLAHISSSAVRRELAAGNTARAHDMLPDGFGAPVAKLYAPADKGAPPSR